MSNKFRIDRAEKIVKEYADTLGISKMAKHTQITDLITDLRHWMEANKVSWHAVRRTSNLHFSAETNCRCKVCGIRFGEENNVREDICDECEEARASGNGDVTAPGKGVGVSEETLQPGPRGDGSVS